MKQIVDKYKILKHYNKKQYNYNLQYTVTQ